MLLWFEKEWAAFEKNEQAIETYADKSLQWATQGLKVILDKIDPTSEAAKIITEILRDISTVSATIFDFGAGASLADKLTAIGNNLGALLTDAHIVNTGKVASITKVVNVLTSLASIFLKIAPAVV